MRNPTLEFYARTASEYAKMPPGKFALGQRAAFIAQVPDGAKILELGSGGGHDALEFLRHGFDVTMIDGSAELAKNARSLTGRTVEIMDFLDIAFNKQFGGVWANASLLHVHSKDLPLMLDKIFSALSGDGLLFCCFKIAKKDWHDKFGRYYCAMDDLLLVELLQTAGFINVKTRQIEGTGYDGKTTGVIWANALKSN